MHFTQTSGFAIASTKINQYFSAQVPKTSVELKPLIAKKIKVERVGFTRNASNNPLYCLSSRRTSLLYVHQTYNEAGTAATT